MTIAATRVTLLAHALEAAFRAWANETPTSGSIEKRARMQLIRELGVLPERLEMHCVARAGARPEEESPRTRKES